MKTKNGVMSMDKGMLAGIFDNKAINTMRHNLDGSSMQVFAGAAANNISEPASEHIVGGCHI